MKLKVFTFRFSDNTGGFNDEAMQAFIADKEVIEFSEHFFVHEKTPWLTVVLAYRPVEDSEKKRPIRRPDSRNELDDKEKQVYDTLRAWRAARAKAEGIPPYMIANNKQLAKMIRSRVQSRTALTAIQGIGDAKVAKYGEEILEILKKHLVQAPAETPEVERESQK